MEPNLTTIRTLLAAPDRPDIDALCAVINMMHTASVLACLAPPGTLVQIAAALEVRASWDCAGWERHIGDLVEIITDPRCLSYEQMLRTWSAIPSAVGALRDRSADLVKWAEQRLNTEWYANLATLLGPSDAAARFLANATNPGVVDQALRRWSMATDPYDPTAWQAAIAPDARAVLYNATRWDGLPAWGWNAPANSNAVRDGIIDDLFDGWPLDHPSIRGRIAWLERYFERHDADPEEADPLAVIASVANSDALADAVCALIWQEDSKDRVIQYVVHEVPWDRLHPRIRIAIAAAGQTPPERADQDWWSGREGRVVRFWNPDVPAEDLRAGTYAELILWLKDRQNVQGLIALLDTLPPDRRARFEEVIAWRLGARADATRQGFLPA